MDESETIELLDNFISLAQNVSSEKLKDAGLRRQLLDCSRKLTFALEEPADAIILRAFNMSLDVCPRVCIDLGVFKLLADRGGPMTAEDISAAVGAETQLMVRLMRGVCAIGFAKEIDVDTYAANAVTIAIATPALEAGYSLIYDHAAWPKSTLSEAPTFFKENGYKSPESVGDNPYQWANDCVGKNAFDHWSTIPGELERFNRYMHSVRGNRPIWLEWFPSEVIFQKYTPNNGKDVLLVDVGGGHGHDLLAFAKKYPDARGRLILQDLPQPLSEIDGSSLDKRIELQEHDFFTAQSLEGARVYFMHMIMHDWPENDCIKILENIKMAMKPEYSILLINDAIVADRNPALIHTSYDIAMMVTHSGLERSEKMWYDLIDAVEGLQIVKFWHPPKGEGIIQIQRI